MPEWDSNPGPLAYQSRLLPRDQRSMIEIMGHFWRFYTCCMKIFQNSKFCQKKMYIFQTHFGFTNMGSSMHHSQEIANYFCKFWSWTPSTSILSFIVEGVDVTETDVEVVEENNDDSLSFWTDEIDFGLFIFLTTFSEQTLMGLIFLIQSPVRSERKFGVNTQINFFLQFLLVSSWRILDSVLFLDVFGNSDEVGWQR